MGKFMRVLADNILSTLGPEGRIVAIDGVDGSCYRGENGNPGWQQP